MNKIEKAALILAAVGTGIAWILPSLFADLELPAVLLSRWQLLVCAPAVVLGLRSIPRYGGFAKGWMILAGALLCVAGIAWTDPTEMGRGAVMAAGIIAPIPIAALVRKDGFLRPFLWAFSIATAVSLAFSLASAGVRFATMPDYSGSRTADPNTVGVQVAMAALLLLMTFPKSRFGSAFCAALIALLLLGCVLTASRTAFLSTLGAGAVAALVSRRNLNRKTVFAGAGILLCFAAISSSLGSDRPFYQGIYGRLIEDSDGTRGTFGGRVQIWEMAGQRFDDLTWLYGLGTGGVDKALGESSIGAETVGADGIARVSPHNTLVWCFLAFGMPGLTVALWVSYQMAQTAYRLDRQYGHWQRRAILIFAALAGMGLPIIQESSWFVLASAILVSLSGPAALRRIYRPVRVVQDRSVSAACLNERLESGCVSGRHHACSAQHVATGSPVNHEEVHSVL